MDLGIFGFLDFWMFGVRACVRACVWGGGMRCAWKVICTELTPNQRANTPY